MNHAEDIMNANGLERRSVLNFVLLEFALSIPFWGIGALAQAHVIPDQVLFRAAWSLTPMMAASILVYRENKAAGVKEFLSEFSITRESSPKSGIWLYFSRGLS